MSKIGLVGLLAGAALALPLAAWALWAEQPPDRAAARRAFEAGNFQDAYEAFRRLALDPQTAAAEVAGDLNAALAALRNLGRIDELDELREAAVAAHGQHWRLLQAAAESYAGGESFGFVVAGKFQRGHHRGGGRLVNSFERDRVRALQLFEQALPLARADAKQDNVGAFLVAMAGAVLGNRGAAEAWRLQYLTDLAQLPDYEEGWYFDRGAGGAPVDADGQPIYHRVPASYAAAQSDGERWRWLLAEAAETSPARLNEVRFALAEFLRQQFGEQTLAQWSYFFGRQDDTDEAGGETTGTFALDTLGEDETIATLATGIRRFKLPDEFNYLRLYRQIAGEPRTGYAEAALAALAESFENRRQYPQAAEIWQRSIQEYGPGQNDFKLDRRRQIEGNWGRFEPIATQPAGKGATVEFRFRNGRQVQFVAHAIKVEKLLDDVKAYLKSRPRQLEWQKINIGDVGYRLVQENQQQYLGAEVARWELPLDPRPRHLDQRITVATPLQKAGAYLLTANVAGGNSSHIILWLADTAIVKKPLPERTYHFLADAASGQPIAKANVEFFGWRQRHVRDNVYQVDVLNFAEHSDADGQVITTARQQPNDYQWLAIARTKEGRFAYLGFTGVWYGPGYDAEYEQTKVYVITDRPVYRPAQTAKFKVWVRHAKYDQEDTSSFAGQNFTVQVHNPQGEVVLEKQFTADAYGGFDGEFPLAADAALGVYGINVVNHGGGSFRVEEYKKPEFEVTVEAPAEPVMLGEKIAATVKARYYFGGPVTSAKVKYKVHRTSHAAHWYPRGIWDWFYGPGYWWFAYDYLWYPGWREWGCLRPAPWWWWGRAQQPPELVADQEAVIGPDGQLKIEIDTAAAKAIHPDQDHQYQFTVEVVDQSRRTIVGAGTVLVARKPFKVFAWVDRGYYRTGDVVRAEFQARRLDGQPIAGQGQLQLLKIAYNEKREPLENVVEQWQLDTDEQGHASIQAKAAEPGQYRWSYRLTDAAAHTIEGGYIFTVIGQGMQPADFRFNDVELVPERREYQPGEKARLQVNAARPGSVVLLFARAAGGVYQPPKVLRLAGKTALEEIEIAKRDMPNIFLEAVTVADGKVFSETRELVVPPEKRVLNLEVLPSAATYKPGQQATVKLKVTDFAGRPFVGSTVLAVYDKAVEYISGGSNVPEIRAFFWKWRRQHYARTESNLLASFYNLVKPNAPAMANLGIFGESAVEETEVGQGLAGGGRTRGALGRAPAKAAMRPGTGAAGARPGVSNFAAEGLRTDLAAAADERMPADAAGGEEPPGGPPLVQPTVRTKFADTALWVGSLATDQDGLAEVSLDMPENLTTWKIKAWGMGHGTKVGQGEAEVITRKDLIVRLQAPRFFVQTDEVVLSANVHNYLDQAKHVEVVLEVEGGQLAPADPAQRRVEVAAGGEARVDWRVRVTDEGQPVVRMKALTDEESDAMEMRLPAYVHGMLKTDSYSGALRPADAAGKIAVRVPEKRRPAQSRLEVRYSPTLAGALVDALPYLVEYPYESTDQTLDRFLPTVIVQKILLDMRLDLAAIRDKRTNLNAQEIGDPAERAKGWQRFDRNPVFDAAEVLAMSKRGVQHLAEMQLGDGGWGWFSGWGEHSSPHTTAYVVHGLQLAQQNDVALVPGVLERGVEWLTRYQDEQVQLIKNADGQKIPWKLAADNLDAFVFLVLTDAGVKNDQMLSFLYRDRIKLAVYAKGLLGLACHKLGDREKLDLLLANIRQFVVQDEENQTAYLRLPEDNHWWFWYGSEVEANSFYLMLLARTNPQDPLAARLVKYLLNNRKHATYWNSTRDTAIAIRALAEYLVASGEDRPEMTVEVWIDGQRRSAVEITAANLFAFDNKLVLEGAAVPAGEHQIELKKQGRGPLYYNAYLTNFTLEDPIGRAGLEIKFNRKFYRLVPEEKTVKASGARGQAVDQRVEKYRREELANLATLASGDLVEVELEIDSKNDYEYLLFEDLKLAGCEPVDLRSGYGGNDLGAYMELRDDRVTFFKQALARGQHSVRYRLRAEIPGQFSALPARASALYAPELRANSDEWKLRIADGPPDTP